MGVHALRKSVFLAAALALTACTDHAEFNARPYDAELSVSMNWQQVYANILRATRGCYAGSSIIISSAVVDGQLYPDLGYGEITHGESALIPTTFTVTRVEKTSSGAIIRIKMGRPGSAKDSAFFQKWAGYWANGGQLCPRIGASLPPA